MSITSAEQTRRFAVGLLNRLPDQDFGPAEIALVARILPLIDADLADWLNSELRGTVSRVLITAAARSGKWRDPALPDPAQPPIAAGKHYVVGEKGLSA